MHISLPIAQKPLAMFMAALVSSTLRFIKELWELLTQQTLVHHAQWSGIDACAADLEDIRRLPYVRAVLAESLRLYPQPPILIRRALSDDVLPAPLNGDPNGYPIGKGADLFISVWNLHRSV